MKKGLIIMLLFILISSIVIYAIDCSKINSELAEKIKNNIKNGMGNNIPGTGILIRTPSLPMSLDLARTNAIKATSTSELTEIKKIIKGTGLEIEIGGSNARRAILTGEDVILPNQDLDLIITYPKKMPVKQQQEIRNHIRNILWNKKVYLDDSYDMMTKDLARFISDDCRIDIYGKITGDTIALEHLTTGVLKLTEEGKVGPTIGLRATRRLQDGTASTLALETKERIVKATTSLFRDTQPYSGLDDASKLAQEIRYTMYGDLDKQLYNLLRESDNSAETLNLISNMGYEPGLSNIGYNLNILKGKHRKLTLEEIKSVFAGLKRYNPTYLEKLTLAKQLDILKNMYPPLRDMFGLTATLD